MCGIAGYIGNKVINKFDINETLDLMKNRGPDHQDYKCIKCGELNVYMLHSRLRIIDLNDRSNQPFTLNNCTLIFNGEIYNYLELRKNLEKLGQTCKTHSDTEVLLRYYLLYGEKCVDYFEGMWSFAIFDINNNKLFLSRDRFAEKPLYYCEISDGFYFGSEIKFIKRLSRINFSVNYQHILRNLVNGYKSLYKTNQTYFNDIKELSFASNIIINCDFRKKIYSYWKPEIQEKKISIQDAIEKARYYLLKSIKIRLRSDVPLAFCLSGGIDSTSLASIAAKEFNYNVSTFSILDKDERYNEYDNIKATIDDLNCNYTFIELSYENTFTKLKELINYHDAPIATITYFIHSFLSEKISEKGYKVAFSGTSADELFTGYYDHFILHLYEMRNHSMYQNFLGDWQKYIEIITRNPYLKNSKLYFNDPCFREHIYDNNEGFTSYLNNDFKEDFQEQDYTPSLLRNRMLNELFHEITPVILHEDDLNSMKYSIENRSPYLDKDLFDFVYSIPSEFLIKNGYGKYILREAVKGILNDKVRLDRRKRGFNASIKSIVDFNDSETKDFLLNDSPVFDLVNKLKIQKLLTKKNIPNSISKFIFNFINTKIFLEMNN